MSMIEYTTLANPDSKPGTVPRNITGIMKKTWNLDIILQHADLFSNNPSLNVQKAWTPWGMTTLRNLSSTTAISSFVSIHGIGAWVCPRTAAPVSKWEWMFMNSIWSCEWTVAYDQPLMDVITGCNLARRVVLLPECGRPIIVDNSMSCLLLSGCRSMPCSSWVTPGSTIWICSREIYAWCSEWTASLLHLMIISIFLGLRQSIIPCTWIATPHNG